MPIKTACLNLKVSPITLLLGCGLILQSTIIFAADSIWYRNNDPLKTEALLPPAIPDGYLERTACVTANYDHALTLAEVAEAALCNNPQTRAAYASARVQAAQVGVAKSAYLPIVSDNVSGNLNVAHPEQSTRSNPHSNLSNNIVASYLLYDFGNRDANLENTRQLLQAASATQSSVVQALLLSAIQAFYQVQAGVAALGAALESERASEESFKAAQARYKAGVSTPAEQTLFAQNTLSSITAEGALKTAYGTLANVMGLAANQPLKLVANNAIQPLQNVGQDINALIEQAAMRRPDLIASEAQLKAALANIDASRAAAKPSVSVAVSNSIQDGSSQSFSSNSALGVTVSIPLFSGYGPSYKIRSAEATADLRAAQRDQLRLQIP